MVNIMPELYIYKSKIQDLAKKEGMRVSSTFYEALSKKVEEIVKEAIKKAKAHKKKTLTEDYL